MTPPSAPSLFSPAAPSSALPPVLPAVLTATVSESKFADLKAKLRELFELDKSDLDFGIYRIMAAKNKEVTEFLDRQLKDVVRETLTTHGVGASEQVQAELDKAIAQAQALGADAETLPKVKELRAKLALAGGGAVGELEADIFNHLLAFFGRYYDEGDFISKRRYKGDVYAIPYGGEEVTLHWANKDQYYIKSGEWHKDYRFKAAGGKTVHFKLVEATQETNNNKEAEEAKRRYILAPENPLQESERELVLRFEFRTPTEAEKARAADRAVAIFGGKYAGSTKGEEREQFCADAEKRALQAMSAGWGGIVTVPAATEGKPLRTLLGKHMDEFTARNTFDYFIHKDLSGFLRRELDFYIKNEVVRLDDLDVLPEDHLARVQGKVKAIRRVAGRIIEFLASIENFQKKMWLKKKLVLETNWLVTVDRISPALRDVVARNAKQWEEWEKLGFKPEAGIKGVAGLFGSAKWGTRKYLDENDKLVVDTRLFKESGPDRTLELFTDLASQLGDESLDASVTGTLIHGENFQALRLIGPSHRASIQTAYIDPPYNTGHDGFAFKDSFKSSSWSALIRDRLAQARLLLCKTGVLFASINEIERSTLESQLRAVFGSENRVEEVVWVRDTVSNNAPTYSTNHEYVEVFSKDRAAVEADGHMFRARKPGAAEVEQLLQSLANAYPPTDHIESALRALYKEHYHEHIHDALARGESRESALKSDPWKGLYPYKHAEYRDKTGTYVPPEDAQRLAAEIWVWREVEPSMPSGKQSKTISDPKSDNYRFYEPTNPIAKTRCKAPKRGWAFPQASDGKRPSFEKYCADHRIVFKGDDSIPQLKYFLKEVDTIVSTSVMRQYADGEPKLEELFGRKGLIDNPKPPALIEQFVRQTSSGCACVLDFFAGSGTTAHAVLMANRIDSGARRFLLIEMGRYFETVLRPRTVKNIYSPDWKDGRAQAHGKGVSALVKYFTLESYEDALNNLPAPAAGVGGLLAGMDAGTKDALISYSLDLEMGPNLLNLEAFRDPWGYTINAQPAGEGEIRSHRVDLVETFNYLVGLKVKAYGPLERYSAEFEKAAHAEGLGRVKVKGRLRKDKEGQYMFQRVEGELNDGNATRVLVVWRKLTNDPEHDAAVLEAWMSRHREDTQERSGYREYHQIYINGPVTLPQPTAEMRTVHPIEQTFKDRMFEDPDGAQHG